MLDYLTIYIVADSIVITGCASYWNNFSVQKLTLFECLPFGGQVLFGADTLFFCNYHTGWPSLFLGNYVVIG